MFENQGYLKMKEL